MKKILFIALALVTALSSCAQKGKSMEKKTLVAYFSATGTTKAVAERLAKAAKADLYEITPEQLYTDADLDWRNKESRSSVEMQNLNSRPKIKGSVENIDQYDKIYIGFPIWWYTCPTIINTFIESYDLNGKTLIPFATSGSSTIEKTCNDLKAKYPSLTWKEGKLMNSITDKELKKWAKE